MCAGVCLRAASRTPFLSRRPSCRHIAETLTHVECVRFRLRRFARGPAKSRLAFTAVSLEACDGTVQLRASDTDRTERSLRRCSKAAQHVLGGSCVVLAMPRCVFPFFGAVGSEPSQHQTHMMTIVLVYGLSDDGGPAQDDKNGLSGRALLCHSLLHEYSYVNA
eukprot:6191733-Pleurochrysis_carterae.AAC.2